jgi:hypothetical protein
MGNRDTHKAREVLSGQTEKKYPKSASLHQSLFLISMAAEQQILSYDLGKL